MPEKSLTVAAYAAGASFAAATLVYVFGPTFFLDDDAAGSSRGARRKGVIGLSNPANDCFINSVLQALAGLPELRLYLIREVHRRNLDGKELYNDLTAATEEQRSKKQSGKAAPEWMLLGLQRGLITAALKDMLDALNERPIYKKTISAQAFILAIEQAFRTRVSRYQQDAQELLQIIMQRLSEEHNAAQRVRKRARRLRDSVAVTSDASGEQTSKVSKVASAKVPPEDGSPIESAYVPGETTADRDQDAHQGDNDRDATEKADHETSDEAIFPFEGKIESHIECSYCHFSPKASISSFATLTLNVPHDTSSTTLNTCFDGMLKVEHIDDFKCDRCRLEHALQVNSKALARGGLSTADRQSLESDQRKLTKAISDDPENPPNGVKLPELSTAPKRRISRHMRISVFPQVLAIHLSRSLWDGYSTSSKNMAKVSFPETLALGGLMDRKQYRLLSVVTHKGGHNSGHYETFRRQWLSPPYSTPTNMGREGIYSLHASPAASPRLEAVRGSKDEESNSLTPDSPASSTASSHSLQRLSLERRKPPTSVPVIETERKDSVNQGEAGREATDGEAIRSGQPSASPLNISQTAATAQKRKAQDRWWRISDDKVKESKTSEVLNMQREVYLLFYELT